MKDYMQTKEEQYIDSLISICGWEFIPSRDVQGKAVPEEWRNEDVNETLYDIEDVKSWILEYIRNYRACGL
jgi:hypothetical protein